MRARTTEPASWRRWRGKRVIRLAHSKQGTTGARTFVARQRLAHEPVDGVDESRHLVFRDLAVVVQVAHVEGPLKLFPDVAPRRHRQRNDKLFKVDFPVRVGIKGCSQPPEPPPHPPGPPWRGSEGEGEAWRQTSVRPHARIHRTRTCTRTCARARASTCTRTHVHSHTRAHTRACTRTHAHTHRRCGWCRRCC